jgi:hypothetical protein
MEVRAAETPPGVEENVKADTRFDDLACACVAITLAACLVPTSEPLLPLTEIACCYAVMRVSRRLGQWLFPT